MLKLLIRTLGLTFYQQHAGLFIVFFYLLFGMIQGYDLISFHIALLVSICSSPINLCLLFLFWLLYSAKCLHFVKLKLKLDEYSFTNTLSSLRKEKQLKAWLRLYAFLLLPILIYSMFVLVTAIKHNYYYSALASIFAMFVLLGSLTFQTYRLTNFAFVVTKKWLVSPTLVLNKPFWSWPIFYLLTEQRLVLVVCKVVSIFFFKAVLWIFADVGNDVRVFLTATLAMVLSHATLVLHLVKFDAVYAGFAKQLPIGSLRRFFQWFLVFFILLLPEFLLMFTNREIKILDATACFAFSMAMMLFLQSLVYALKANMDKYMRLLLFFFFITMLAILAGYFVVFTIAIFILSIVFLLRNYRFSDCKDLVI